jgi:Sec-independent protein secretion pathway component TatC
MTEKSSEMTLWGHLEELRKRLLYSLIALAVGMIVAVIFSDFLLALISLPIGGFENLLSIQVTEN